MTCRVESNAGSTRTRAWACIDASSKVLAPQVTSLDLSTNRHGPVEEYQPHHRKQALPGEVCISKVFDHEFATDSLDSILAANSTRSLTERGITHILSVCCDQIPAEVPESGFRHMRIAVEDVPSANLLIHLPVACRWIDQALRSGGVVLVHCYQGLSRSAAVIAAYSKHVTSTPAITYPDCMLLKSCGRDALLLRRQWSSFGTVRKANDFSHAIHSHLKYVAREQIWINESFIEQLVLFELCGYQPSETNGIYMNWKLRIDREAGLRR